MAAFDFFSDRELVRPKVTEADAERIVRDRYGLTGTATELGSQQDRNFRIDVMSGQGGTSGGAPSSGTASSGTASSDAAVTRYVLKVDNPAFSTAELTAQTAAMGLLASRGVKAPVPVAGLDGNVHQSWPGPDGELPVRLFTFVEGGSLVDAGHLAPPVIHALGALAGHVASELADFTADGLDRTLQWDMRLAAAVIQRLAPFVTDVSRRDRVLAVSADADAVLATVSDDLRLQTIHGDVTDDNVICSNGVAEASANPGLRIPDSVIDFGDLGTGWLVAELAVCASSVLPHNPENPLDVMDAISSFDEIVPLNDAEITALWPLIVLRGAVLTVSGAHQISIDGGNDYARERMDAEWRVFELAASVSWAEAEMAIRRALGRPPRASTVELSPVELNPVAFGAVTPMIPSLAASVVEMLDFSTGSDALADGRWLDSDCEWQLATEALTRADAVVAPYGQFRLTRTPARSTTEPATCALLTEVWLTAGSIVVAPVDGIIDAVVAAEPGGGAEIVLGTATGLIRITGVTPTVRIGRGVSAGDHLGIVAPQRSGPAGALGRICVQLLVGQRRDAGTDGIPEFVTASRAAALREIAADPSILLGLPRSASPAAWDHETKRRQAVMAGAQEKYYETPPQIERGWQELLVDTQARSYLDLVNNVASLGHSHPRFTAAVHAQMQRLNTNSRFLYSALADLCERIVDVAPDPSLDTVLLVNSGSEAVDLALRLAQIHTGRRAVVSLREGYHGWTMASDAVSTSAFDNPSALASRPDWVHVAEVPNSYRGIHRGPDAAERYAEDLAELLDAPGGPGEDLAAFISEPVLGNAGGVIPPQGYLARVYQLIRDRGGLCIADEVQVGYGRLGSHFWGVQQQGVTPDIITIAKAMGNGYPLGAVITRRDIAESLATEGNFFSSAGGSPVSCVAGLTVLDVIRDENLQANAHNVGAHLTARLAELADRHPLIGQVHGQGLYQGIELVRDRQTREPAVAETTALCERMRELGVIIQPASERQNVLKIKPPMCFSLQSADFFVDCLETALAELG